MALLMFCLFVLSGQVNRCRGNSFFSDPTIVSSVAISAGGIEILYKSLRKSWALPNISQIWTKKQKMRLQNQQKHQSNIANKETLRNLENLQFELRRQNNHVINFFEIIFCWANKKSSTPNIPFPWRNRTMNEITDRSFRLSDVNSST